MFFFKFIYMILKLTNLLITDKTNGVWLKTFHLYKGFFRKYTITGLTVRGSIRKIKVPSITYKSLKYKSMRVGYSRRALLVVSNKIYKTKCSFTYKVYSNCCVIYGKRKNLKTQLGNNLITTQVKQRKHALKALNII